MQQGAGQGMQILDRRPECQRVDLHGLKADVRGAQLDRDVAQMAPGPRQHRDLSAVSFFQRRPYQGDDPPGLCPGVVAGKRMHPDRMCIA